MNHSTETFEKYERKRSTKRNPHDFDNVASCKGWSASKQKKNGAMRGIQRALKRMEIE